MPFQTTEINKGLNGAQDKMAVAGTQIKQFSTTIAECNDYWQKYKAAEDDQTRLAANAVAFSADAKQLTSQFMPDFAVAVAIIAGGSLSVDGDATSPPLTVRDIAEQLVASAVAQGLMAPEA